MHASIQRPARAYAGELFGRCQQGIANLQQRASRALKNLHLRQHLTRQRVRNLLPQAGIIAGAAACGLWLNSIFAGLFGLVLLFLLWKISRSLERITGVLRTQPPTTLASSGRAASSEATSQRNIYISAKAMERLRPWVEDESALTEESAKAYCSVLLDTLAMLHPRLAGKASLSDSWS